LKQFFIPGKAKNDTFLPVLLLFSDGKPRAFFQQVGDPLLSTDVNIGLKFVLYSFLAPPP